MSLFKSLAKGAFNLAKEAGESARKANEECEELTGSRFSKINDEETLEFLVQNTNNTLLRNMARSKLKRMRR